MDQTRKTHRTLKPPRALQPYVLQVMYRVDPSPAALALEAATPRPTINLNLGDAYEVDPKGIGSFQALPEWSLWGPQTRAFLGRPTGVVRFLAAELTPLGVRALCGGVPRPFAGAILKLDDILQTQAREAFVRVDPAVTDEQAIPLFLRALSVAFGERREACAFDASVGAVLEDAPIFKVDAWASVLSLSTRQLHERLMREWGIGPKRLLRLTRFRRALFAAHPQPWLTLSSYDGDFSDQAHLIREFKAFSGFTPARYTLTKRRHRDALVFTIPLET